MKFINTNELLQLNEVFNTLKFKDQYLPFGKCKFWTRIKNIPGAAFKLDYLRGFLTKRDSLSKWFPVHMQCVWCKFGQNIDNMFGC